MEKAAEEKDSLIKLYLNKVLHLLMYHFSPQVKWLIAVQSKTV